jgi:hypothetical protein
LDEADEMSTIPDVRLEINPVVELRSEDFSGDDLVDSSVDAKNALIYL